MIGLKVDFDSYFTSDPPIVSDMSRLRARRVCNPYHPLLHDWGFRRRGWGARQRFAYGGVGCVISVARSPITDVVEWDGCTSSVNNHVAAHGADLPVVRRLRPLG